MEIIMKILYAEDEMDLHRIVKRQLSGLGHQVDGCSNGEEAIDYLQVSEYDIAILDIMMPKKDGYEVLKYIRSHKKNLPVIFLTAKDSVSERVKGLDLGADDYLVKPFSFEELAARIRANTRVVEQENSTILRVLDLSMEILTRVVKRGDVEIQLSAKEYDLLELFMRNVGIILSREKIENHIWNFDYEGGTNLVDVYVRYLRKKIDEPFEQKLIHTVRGIGYVMRIKG